MQRKLEGKLKSHFLFKKFILGMVPEYPGAQEVSLMKSSYSLLLTASADSVSVVLSVDSNYW